MLIPSSKMVRVLCLVALSAVVLCVSITLSEDERKNHPRFRRPSRSKMRTISVIPKCSDAREQWLNCHSIRSIRDQGQCGTCWAVPCASVISDRICIASGQIDQTYVSALHLATCFNATRTGQQNCDDGGDPADAYRSAAFLGYITGGDFANVVGCEPYPLLQTAAPLACPNLCTHSKYLPTNPSADIRLEDVYWTHYGEDVNDPAVPATLVENMQAETMANGPITAAIDACSDLQPWTVAQGAYRGQAPHAVNKTGHAVRVIGWCQDQNGVPYWMIANSWGTDLGEGRIYWIERGRNFVNVEKFFSAPIVRVAQSCPTSACMTGVDQIIRLDITNMNSPVYAFQGNCTVQVTLDATTGKMTPVGKPAPISAVFINATPGPIVGYQSDSIGFFLRSICTILYLRILATLILNP